MGKTVLDCFMSDCNCLLQQAIPEKIQTGGLEDMDFPGVLKKKYIEIPGVN